MSTSSDILSDNESEKAAKERKATKTAENNRKAANPTRRMMPR